ncbi:MAG: hypothetical protein CMH64_03485 [Nanoarchaeota archaeon]|nr:hypothetical protein [Nanoarchaeota archaeon]|tara:strand:+ start:156 stop:551 length:396 start_codon:yes stop_codon:yes gene_type:complete
MEIQIKAIIEILGKPKEHVESTMEKVLSELKNQKNLTIINQEIAETKELEKFFSTFVDLELKLDSLDNLIDFCFDFLPSSIEIVEPEKLDLNSEAMAEYMNDLLAKLHQQSMLIRNLHAENTLMKKQLENK